MKVDIKTGTTKKGLVKKVTYYNVDLIIQLNEEEKQIIEQFDLGHIIVHERVAPASFSNDGVWMKRIRHILSLFKSFVSGQNEGEYNLKLIDLVRGKDKYDLFSPRDANIYKQELIASLKEIKEFLNENLIPLEDESFEL